MKCINVLAHDEHQQTQHTKRRVLGKWFNIGDRSKKLHHRITYVTKISLTVLTTQ